MGEISNIRLSQKRYSINSEVDGLEISVLRIVPSGEIKGVVQIVHGMCEYKERYMDFMLFLAEHGYATVIHDNRGHGKSIKDTSDLGYFYEGGYKGLVEDIHLVMNDMKKDYGSVPYYLLGHSMGSLAVRTFIKKYDSEIDKLFVVGCPSKLSGMKAGLILINIIKYIKGEKKHSKLLDYLVIKSNFEKKYKSEGLIHAWVNSDRKSVEAYNQDPFCNFTFTVNGYLNLVKLSIETYSLKRYKLNNPKLYIRFLSGAGDPCGISKKNIWLAMQCLKNAGYRNVRGKLYEGMRHEILNEPNREKVYNDILHYLNS